MTLTLGHFLSLGAILFALAVIGIFLNRKNLIILLMAIAIVVTIQRFHPLDRTAAWLMAPYLAWVSFASILNVALLALNGKF